MGAAQGSPPSSLESCVPHVLPSVPNTSLFNLRSVSRALREALPDVSEIWRRITWEVYARRKAAVRLPRCLDIVTPLVDQSGAVTDAISAPSSSGVAASLGRATINPPLEHHAILDTAAREVIHYCYTFDDPTNKVRVESLEHFEVGRSGQWQVKRIPTSLEHAQQILARARSRVGEAEYSLVSNNCEGFANWCFDEYTRSGQVRQVLASGTASTGAGLATGFAVASITTTATVTTTSPAYVLGFIPWGTTQTTSSTTIAALSGGSSAALGVGAGVAVLAGCYGVGKWIQYGKTTVAARVPVGVYNGSAAEVKAELESIDNSILSWSQDKLVLRPRSFFGMGSTDLVLGSIMAGELNPPLDLDRFCLRIFLKGSSSDGLWPSWHEVGMCKVRRGDVVEYTSDGNLTKIPDPGPGILLSDGSLAAGGAGTTMSGSCSAAFSL